MKKNRHTFCWCHKLHGKAGKSMWYAHKPSDHQGSKVKNPVPNSESSVVLELTDDLRSLLATIKLDFS